MSFINIPDDDILNNIRKLLAENEIELVENTKAVDLDLWKNFSLIQKSNCIYRSHAICKRCYLPLALRNNKGVSIGTNNLKRHKCRIPTRQLTVEQFMKPKVQLSTVFKDQLKETITNFIVNGYHSFRTADQLELKDIFSLGVKYGSLYHNIDVNEAWSGRMTVSRHIQNTYLKSQEDLKCILRNPIKMNSVCLLSDIWTDPINHNSFLDVTVHYVNENFKTQSNCLSFSHFPSSHTSSHILAKITQVCENFQINIENTSFVTDSASNYICALSGANHYRCMAHRLHTIVKDAWENAKKCDPETSILSQKIIECKRYFHKSADKESRLPYKIPSDSSTRPWSGLRNLFNCFKLSYLSIKETLLEEKQESIFPYNERLIDCYDIVFSSIDIYFKGIQQNAATLHLWIVNLVEMMDLAQTWPCEVSIFSSKFLEGLEKKCASNITKAHVIAVFFHPNYKKLECLKWITHNDEVRNAASDIASTILNFFEIQDSRTQLIDDFSGSIENQPNFPQKRRFMDPIDTLLPLSKVSLIEKEIQNYLHEPVSKVYDDPLIYWSQCNYSNLKNLARSIYSIPASSAECERHASRAGLTLQKIRNRLKPCQLEKLVFLRDYNYSKF